MHWKRELPTWGLVVVIHGGWLGLTWFATALPLAVFALAGAWALAWHSSLQHEACHGHPTSSPRLNAWLVGAPLSLWLPFAVYRQSHLAHHRSPHLTHPLHDPESAYVGAGVGPLSRALLYANQTLLGRLVLGPWIVVASTWHHEIRNGHIGVWLRHAAAVALVLGWVCGVCGVSFWQYALFAVWPGLGLTLVRSFAEHWPDADPRGRTAVVERAPVLGLLFLYNNLHVVHHERPGIPWYRLPSVYAAQREALHADPRVPVFKSYGEILHRWGVIPKHSPVHPAEAT